MNKREGVLARTDAIVERIAEWRRRRAVAQGRIDDYGECSVYMRIPNVPVWKSYWWAIRDAMKAPIFIGPPRAGKGVNVLVEGLGKYGADRGEGSGGES